MNPLDALFVPPALVKRALDDLHDIATLARRYAGLEADVRGLVARLELEVVQIRGGIETLDDLLEGVRAAVGPLAGQIAHMEQQLDGISGELAPMRNLEPIRRGIEPLEKSMLSVRESVDELEPMIADLDRRIQSFDPRLEEMQAAIEPIGDLAEKLPGNRRRRAAG